VTILHDDVLAAPTAETRPGVLLVEDHQLLAQSLSLALQAEGFRVDIAELFDVGSDVDSVAAAARRLAPQIVLLDLDLGESIGDGRDLIRALCDGGAQVLVVSGSSDRSRLADCLELGAAGVLSKTMPYERLVQAVIDLAAGQVVMTESERCDLLAQARLSRRAEGQRAAPFEELTARERQVLAAMMEGKSCESIAEGWFVSLATVRTQIRAVLTKLEVGSQLAAVSLAFRAGWSGPS
jgi:two-component system nitrate/nitrite response regulator NarL